MANFQEGLTLGSLSNGIINDESNIGYKIKFMVDDTEYYMSSCLVGNSINAPQNPIILLPNYFNGWKVNGSLISFPYTPAADAIANADIRIKNLLVGDNEEIVTLRAAGENVKFTRRNVDPATTIAPDGKDLCAYVYVGGKLGVIVVTKAICEKGIFMTLGNNYADINVPITYNGETFYYNNYMSALWTFDGTDLNDSVNNRYKITTVNTVQSAVELLLDVYYN